MTEDEFLRCVEDGSIVLPHRPFRQAGTPWYGFAEKSLDISLNQLTEVHSTIINPFRELMDARPLLIIGLIAGRETLELNLTKRAQTIGADIDADIRLELAAAETQEIIAAHDQGSLDLLISVDRSSRSNGIDAIVKAAGELYDS
jgi:hypothetical protein